MMIFHSYVSLPEGKPSPTKVYYWIYDWDDFFLTPMVGEWDAANAIG
jgi:hypothetical protein